MSGTIKFLKTRTVTAPRRANRYDAGIDFFVPEFTPEFINDFKEKNPNITIEDKNGIPYCIVVLPGQRVLIPSGIHCQMFDKDRALIAANKSGVATKHGLIFGAQVVDYEYQGEIHLSLINSNRHMGFDYDGTKYVSRGAVEILPGMKILQFLEMPIFTSEIDIHMGSLEDFYKKETTRGAGGFGSTDNK